MKIVGVKGWDNIIGYKMHNVDTSQLIVSQS